MEEYKLEERNLEDSKKDNSSTKSITRKGRKIDFQVFQNGLKNLKSKLCKEMNIKDTKLFSTIIDIDENNNMTVGFFSLTEDPKSRFFTFNDNKFIEIDDLHKIEKVELIEKHKPNPKKSKQKNKLTLKQKFRFIDYLNRFAASCHDLNLNRNFYNHKNVNGSTSRKMNILLALIQTELSNAVMEYNNYNVSQFKKELCDVIIRIFDLAEFAEINIGNEIISRFHLLERRKD